MKRTMLLAGTVLAAAVAASLAFAHGSAETMKRHHYFMRNGVPAPYGDQANPFKGNADAIARGRTLYDQNCALCHGADGAGHGEGAKELKVPPADLTMLVRMMGSMDDFLLWAVAEGGQPFGSPMPAYKDVLGRDDIWRIVAFLEAGLPR